MRNGQRGVSLGGLLLALFVLAFVALIGLKVTPMYIEYFKAKEAIQGIVREKQASSVQDARRAFDNRANIDDISVIKGSDLEVTKEGNEVVISFAYRKEVPLFANVGLYVNFAANSKGQ